MLLVRPVFEGDEVIRFLESCRSDRPWSCLAAIALACLLSTPHTAAQENGFNEAEVKAVFLFNFAQFVVWPDNAFPTRESPFVIGILGDDPFGHVIDDVVKGEGISGRALVVERFRRVEDVGVCHVLFVAPASTEQYLHIFGVLKGRPILTVGDTEGFALIGGMIRFITAQNRIRLRVNVDAAKAANLTISSKLLRSVEVVGSWRPR